MSTSLLCLHELFEQQARQRPRATAVWYGDESIDYGELDRRAEVVARSLRARGAKPGVLVGVCLERSIEMVVALVGVVKAGAAYVPLGPSYPPERLNLMLKDSRVPMVLTHSRLESRLSVPGLQVVCIDRDLTGGADAAPAETQMSAPSDAAYVIYTSGSTGVPKGVVVEHRQATRLFSATQGWFAFDEDDVWTMFHSFGFDFSVWEMWGALLNGGQLVVVPEDVARAPDAFIDLLVKRRVTVLNQTPSAFQQLSRTLVARARPAALSLRVVIFGGEALDPQILRGWIERYGDQTPRLINMYGITETTVHVTYRPIERADLSGPAGSPIGIPIPDLRIHLLDSQGRPVPKGTTGEIFVGGAGVARGYLGRPDLNSQRFVPDPTSADPGARLYRSGDLAVEKDDGYWYQGRGDAQLKIRGFRVEPGEVESCLLRTPGIGEAVVIARDYGHGDRRLVAYIVPEVGKPPSSSEALAAAARAGVTDRLPEHMRPSTYVVLDELPLNINGKIDRAALPAPDQQAALGMARAVHSPTTALELAIEKIWCEVLGVRQVGLDDDFFDLGGTSLGAINALLLIQERLGQLLDMSVWGERSTLREIVGLLAAQAVGGPPSGAQATPNQPTAA